MEDRQRAVGVLVHAHPRLDEVRAQRARRDLEGKTPVAHAVVVADHALLLHAQDVPMDAGGVGDERGRRLLGRDREAGVVLGQVDLAQEPVGGLDRGDAGELELLGQAVLEGAEGALGTPARLGRVGRDVLDPELAERPADLGGLIPGDFSPALGVWK